MMTTNIFDRTPLLTVAGILALIIGVHWLGERYLLLPLGGAVTEAASGHQGTTSSFSACAPETSYTSLTEALRRPDNVCALDLTQSNLNELPPNIGNLTKLRVLILRDNQLTQLPAEMGWLRDLREFDVSNNKLTALPPHIGWMRELKVFNISNNQLTAIPEEIGWLQALDRFDVRGNPLSAAEITRAQEYLPSTSIITE